jgi:hypothetical protein
MQSEEKEYWLAVVTSEINNFLKSGAWELVDKSSVHKKGRKLIGTKHVFKKKIQLDPVTSKEFTRFKDRIVTLGYMQIPGVNFTESFSPVATDTALRICLGLVLYYQDEGWECHSFNMEAAFLEPPMGEIDTYITLPEGLVELGVISEEEAKRLLQVVYHAQMIYQWRNMNHLIFRRWPILAGLVLQVGWCYMIQIAIL